ncbi:MAG TPA: hypothetical protein VND45_08950 [Thermoanaerobaculia bacterium]|nr:hypothetical protein [Thermoanaerobaculia bacterium]
MKKLWIWLGLVVIGIGAALYFGRSKVQTGTVTRPWPLGLGVMADAPKRYPATKDNAQATKLTELATRAAIDLKSVRRRSGGLSEDLHESFSDYVRVQLERVGDGIDAPPSDVKRYFDANAASLDEIRALLLSGQPIVFEADINRNPEHDPPGPHLFAYQQLYRTFVARALVTARDGKPEAWDELRTAWELARPLWNRPDETAVLTASTAARMVSAAARKMPLPPPAWFREISTFPYERALASAQQAEAWRMKTAAMNERLRGMAQEVVAARACDAKSPQFDAVREKLGARASPGLIAQWERLMRFRAEREATERVLQIRAGQTPSKESQCSDGTWQVTPKSFKFSRSIGVRRPQIDTPLEYSATPAPAAPPDPAQSPPSPPAAPATSRR